MFAILPPALTEARALLDSERGREAQLGLPILIGMGFDADDLAPTLAIDPRTRDARTKIRYADFPRVSVRNPGLGNAARRAGSGFGARAALVADCFVSAPPSGEISFDPNESKP